jgi:predicted PurR-regulated permease PerM
MREPIPFAWFLLLLAGAAFVIFLWLAGLASQPLLVLLFGVSLLYPYRRQVAAARHLLWLFLLGLALWLLQSMGTLLLPFVLAFLVAYLCEPLLQRWQRRGIPRWLSALAVVLTLLGAVVALSVLIFPTIFSQLDTLTRQISTLYNTAVSYLESRRFFRTLSRYGIPPELLQQLLQQEILPRLEGIFQALMSSLLAALTSLSRILTHAVNVLLLPILMFYLLKDFPSVRSLLVEVLQRTAPQALQILRQANPIVRLYLSWLLLVSTLLGLVSGTLYVVLDIPYGVMLGLLSGLFNLIPYFGTLMTLGAGAIALLIAQSSSFLRDFLLFALVINGLHFLNAYLIEPRVLGKRIGVHPVVLIFSLILFGTLFGFLGLLVAVPTTAVGALLFNQWRLTAAERATTAPGNTSEQSP